MDIVLYVSKGNDFDAAELVFASLGPLPEGCIVRGMNLFGVQPDDIPAEVLQVMNLKKVGTFPLTMIDGKPVLSGRLPFPDELLGFIRDGVSAPAILVNRADSAVDFPTYSRIHISMDVSNIENSVAFYKVFFGQEPTKIRADYAKFEVLEPPLNLALNQFHVPGRGGPINHFGIQVKSSEAVMAAKERYLKAGFFVEEEVATACCYAVQTKIWVADPDGNRWEVYVVTQADANQGCGPDCICYEELQPNYMNVAIG